MPIATVTEYSAYRKSADTWYVIVQATLADGRWKRKKYPTPDVSGSYDPAAALAQAETDVLAYFKDRDAEVQIQQGTASADGEADIWDVRRAYIKSAFLEEDTVKALTMFDRFFPAIQAHGQANGWVLADYASALQTSTENVQRLNQRWTYLDGNRATIEAFEVVQAGDDF